MMADMELLFAGLAIVISLLLAAGLERPAPQRAPIRAQTRKR